jgi:hypothetical protein
MQMRLYCSSSTNAYCAYNAQAWVLHGSFIGMDYGYDASLASHDMAIELDPNAP